MKPSVVTFIDRCFRDTADHDYIADRTCYRYRLDQQFLWASLQAIEKYLKAILLYNKINTSDLNHSVKKAYERVLAIPDIDFDFTEEVTKFIEYIDDKGENRYFEFPFYLKGDELFMLDRTIWHIRRYCYYMKTTIKDQNGTEIDLFPHEIKKAQKDYYFSNPHKYYIIGGLLESILKDKKNPARKSLVWKNPCFCQRKRKTIKDFPARFSAGNPTHIHHPEVIQELKNYVKFSNKFKKVFM